MIFLQRKCVTGHGKFQFSGDVNEMSAQMKTIGDREARRPKDWTINIKPSQKEQTPTFVRLFVINRVLKDYLSQLKGDTSDEIINAMRSLTSVVKKPIDQENIFSMLSKLAKHGIKTYMNEHCNYNDTTTHVVDQIFNQLILKKLNKEYGRITTYCMNNNNDYQYQCIVFNTKELMCLIFEYCQFYNDKFPSDVYNCSLVCSHWLYDSFNPNSICHIELEKLICTKSLVIDNPKNSRLWQRMVNVKSLSFNSYGLDNNRYVCMPNDFILSKILMLTNIEKIKIDGLQPWNSSEFLRIVVAIMQQCSKNIKDFHIHVYDNHYTPTCDMPPLKLLNAEKIFMKMSPFYFYIIWSNKCKQLLFHDISDSDDKWIKFMIDNCDCSGIEYLEFVEARFWCTLIENSKILIPKWIEKFSNLKRISIHFFQSNYVEFVTFWQYLNKFIRKQNVYVTLELKGFGERHCCGTFKAVDENRLKIDSIRMRISPDVAEMMCTMMVGMGMNIHQLNLQHIFIWSDWRPEGITRLEIFVKRLNELVSMHIEINKTIDDDATKNKSIIKQGVTETVEEKATENKNEEKKDTEVEMNRSKKIDIKHLLINCKTFMPRLEVISIYHLFLPSELSIVNRIVLQLFEFVNQLKRQIYICATFYLESSNGEEDSLNIPLLLKAFKQFCQSMLDCMEQEFVIPFNVELEFENTQDFGDMIFEMKQILSTFSEKVTLIKYKQPQTNENYTSSPIPIFCGTVRHEINEFSFQFGNCN